MSFRLVLCCVLVALFGPDGRGTHARAAPGDGTLLAGIGDGVPALFVKLVNGFIKGRIDPRVIEFHAPASVDVYDLVLFDAVGRPCGRAKKASATLSLTALLTGNVVITELRLEEPQVIATIEDGKLNLLEALTPKAKNDGGKPPDAELRIDRIVVEDGALRFNHEAVTVTADGVTAVGSFALDMRELVPIIRTSAFGAESGSVKLEALDIDMKRVRIQRLAITGDKLELDGATGKVSGTEVLARGTLQMRPPGLMAFSGYGEAPADVWPARLKRPPFTPPAFKAQWSVVGPYENPVVSVDGSFGVVDLYGYRVDEGTAKILVTKDQVAISSSSARVAGGTVEVTGTATIPAVELDLQAAAKGVPLKTAIAPFWQEGEPFGTFGGRARIRGRVAEGVPLSIVGTAFQGGVGIYGAKLPGDTKVAYDVTWEPAKLVLKKVDLDGGGVDASVTGPIFIAEKHLELKVTVAADAPQRLYPSLPDELKAAKGRFEGTVAGPFATTRVVGAIAVSDGDAYGVPFDDATATLDATAKKVIVKDVQGTVAGGPAQGRVDVDLERRPIRLAGKISVQRGDLSLLKVVGFVDQKPRGIVDAEATIAGTVDHPVFVVKASGPDIVIAGEPLGLVRVDVTVDERSVRSTSFKADGPMGRIVGERFEADFKAQTLRGQARASKIDLSKIEQAAAAKLTGTAAGRVVLGGTFDAPTIAVDATAVGVSAGEMIFGDGRAALRVTTEPPAKKGGPTRMLVSASASLAAPSGAWDLRSALWVKEKIVNAQLRFTDVDLGPLTREAANFVQPMQGTANGTLSVVGPLASPTMELRVRSAALTIEPPTLVVAGDASLVPEVPVVPALPADAPAVDESALVAGAEGGLRTLGEVALEAKMVDGALVGRLCAFPGSDSAPTAPCGRGERVQAAFHGMVDLEASTFDVQTDVYLDEDRIEDFVAGLAQEEIGVGGRARVVLRVARKAKDQPVVLTASGSFEKLRAKLPGAPEVFLVEPVDVSWADDELVLAKPAHFATEARDVNVVVDGAVGSKQIALKIDGTVALALAKLATEEIASASGTADAQLEISGVYATGLKVTGQLRPQPGATLQPRALGQRLSFDGGTLRFFPSPVDASLQRIELDEGDALRFRVGDGAAALRGAVDVRTARGTDQTWVASWDLRASGTGIDVRTSDGLIEIAFDAALQGDERAPRLEGRIEVTDGSLRRRFEFRNFVLEQGPGRPSEPMWQRLQPFGLAELTFDVEATLQNLRTRAELSSFQVDASLRGDLRLTGSLRVPQLTGAIEVEEGYVDFPRARFEIQEMQAEFPTTPEGRINPKIRLLAKAEIPAEQAGTDAELPVDLGLEGDLDRMRLDLQALDSNDDGRELTRVELLSLIVFGRPVAENRGEVGAALRAFSSELTGSLTKEVEEQIDRRFGAAVQFDVLADEATRSGGVRVSAGVRYRMGRRLELEGEVPLIDPSGEPTPEDLAQLDARTRAAQQLRLRFLIFDHVLGGQELVLEGRIANGGELGENITEARVGYRLFEQ